MNNNQSFRSRIHLSTTVRLFRVAFVLALGALVSSGGCGDVSSIVVCADGTVCEVGYTCVQNVHDNDAWYCAGPGKELCGNGEIDIERNEQCDGILHDVDTCVDRGFDYGRLRCDLGCTLNETSCHRFNWSKQRIPTAIGRIRHLWGPTADDVYAISIDGGVIHYDGREWSRDVGFAEAIGEEDATAVGLWDLWGDSDDRVVVVGERGTIMHRTDDTWTQTLAIPPDNRGADTSLLGVWGASRDDIYAVGLKATLDVEELIVEPSDIWDLAPEVVTGGLSAILLHYDGDTWTALPALGDSGDTNEFSWFTDIWGTDSNNLFIAGGTAVIDNLVPDAKGVVWHYDGTELREIYSDPERFVLTSMWGVGDQVFVVGMNDTILHCDVDKCELKNQNLNDGLTDVWGTAADNVYASGVTGTLYRYDGISWTPDPDLIRGERLLGVWGTDAHDLYVAGMSTGSLFHLGVEWRGMTLPEPFTGVGHALAIDADRAVAVAANVIFAYQDGQWSIAQVMRLEERQKQLRVVWLDDHMRGFAVGDGCMIYRHAPGDLRVGWTRDTVPDSCADTVLRDVWASGPDDGFAVGENGLVLRYEGQGWKDVSPSVQPGEHLTTVWGSGPDRVFVCGDKGTILRYDGVEWHEIPAPEELMTSQFGEFSCHGLWGADGSVYVVGSPGAILRGDGDGDWEVMTTPLSNTLNSISGTHASDVFAVSELGDILHYDGHRWELVRNSDGALLTSVSVADPDIVFFSGAGGIYHMNRASP